MHSTHRLRQLLLFFLLLLHPVGRVAAGNGDVNQVWVTFFVIADVFVLLVVVWAISSFCKKLQARETMSENTFEAIKSKEHKSSEDVENGVGVADRDEKGTLVTEEQGKAVATTAEEEEEKEEGKITFVKDGGDFDIGDLLRASAELLANVGLGSCYKTKLENGEMVVVKRFRDLRPFTMEEFIKYMRLLSAMEHPNLMPFIGYYYSADEKLLISNYARNGNLYNRIHGKGGNRCPFTWSSRMQVAYGVAKSIEFLHSSMERISIVPHGNLKASNILLDENDNPLVCDYGLLHLVHPWLAMQKMVCYRSPEYKQSRKISNRTDVWSYGCLLLELMTGKESMNSAPGGIHGVQLCQWVNRAVREEWTAEVFDAEIQKRAGPDMIMMLKLALWCCEWLPEKRPEMGAVVREIEHIMTGGVDAEEIVHPNVS
ncbi:pollen receptor-like kinase 4 [Canna indica]|uniref:Pollen receptor-like kinase 4 n=1 Tax=Canna indica TaxID=4628 RepID=A0AAQ3JN76_9LILI|nr:pollen receptor-like kinase 4 [Canna indica]